MHASLLVDAGFMIPPQLWAAQLPAPKEVSIAQNPFEWICVKFSGKVGKLASEQMIKFWW